MLRFFLSLAVFVSFSALHANAIPASRSLAPSCDQYLSILRSKNCSIRDFRKATQKLGLALASKLAGEQAMRSVRVETPLTETSGAVPAKPVMLVPVLRAGLSLLPPFLEFFEDASVGFVGVRRNEETLKPEPYYKNIPELKRAIDTKANWTVGAGFTSDEPTEMLLGTIKGHGKDTFNSILKNQIKVKDIAGDSFAEIILNSEGTFINLKPLDPSTMVIVAGKNGVIIRYEQTTKIKGGKNKIFKVEDIFHLSRERIADEIHGISVVPAVAWIIKARNEAMSDWKIVLHRNVRPMRIWFLDTDDTTQIAAFKAKTDKASAETENIYVPKGTVETEIMSVAPNATLTPLEWIDRLNDYFYQAVGVPQIVVGNAKAFTDASGKIVYLAFEQTVKGEQLFIEEQVLGQLNLEIQLTFPASLTNELVSDQPSEMELEEEKPEAAAQPNDTTEELEGKT